MTAAEASASRILGKQIVERAEAVAKRVGGNDGSTLADWSDEQKAFNLGYLVASAFITRFPDAPAGALQGIAFALGGYVGQLQDAIDAGQADACVKHSYSYGIKEAAALTAAGRG